MISGTIRYRRHMQTELVLSVAERLRLSRLRVGYDQTQMAEIVGVSRPTISDYENGRSEPTVSKLVRWADAADVSLEWLCARRDSNPQPSDWESGYVAHCRYCGRDGHDYDDCPDLEDDLNLDGLKDVQLLEAQLARGAGSGEQRRLLPALLAASESGRQPYCGICGGPHDYDDCPRSIDEQLDLELQLLVLS